jgi:hypothetical protein
MGYDIRTNRLVLADPAPRIEVAGAVTFVKPCRGAVRGTFTAQTKTRGQGAVIEAGMVAECVGTGGLARHCKVGTTRFALPGFNSLQLNQEPQVETHSMVQIWPALAPGRWRFVVQAQGVGTKPAVRVRTFTVDAFKS